MTTPSESTAPTEQMREAFEADAEAVLQPAGRHHPFFVRRPGGSYASDWMRGRWEGWQAAIKQSQKDIAAMRPVQQDGDELNRLRLALDTVSSAVMDIQVERATIAKYVIGVLQAYVAAPAAAAEVSQAAERRRFTGVGHLEKTGYIPAGSAVERETVSDKADRPPQAPKGLRMLTDEDAMDAYSSLDQDSTSWVDRIHAVIYKFCEVNGIQLTKREGENDHE